MAAIPVVGTITDGPDGEPVVHLPGWLIDESPCMWIGRDGTEYYRYGQGPVQRVIRDAQTMEIIDTVPVDEAA